MLDKRFESKKEPKYVIRKIILGEGLVEEILEKDNSSLEALLIELFDRYLDDLPLHPWTNEHARWRELVTCIILANAGEASSKSRLAVNILDELDLINVKDLANLSWVISEPDTKEPQILLMHAILERMGFAKEDISRALLEIANIAQSLESKYEGKIQLYLRQYGQMMIRDLGKDFPGLIQSMAGDENIPDERLQNAFTMWLQNAMTMPIFLNMPSTRRFCDKMGCTIEELVKATDKLGISTSIIDDMLDLWALNESLEDSQK